MWELAVTIVASILLLLMLNGYLAGSFYEGEYKMRCDSENQLIDGSIIIQYISPFTYQVESYYEKDKDKDKNVEIVNIYGFALDPIYKFLYKPTNEDHIDKKRTLKGWQLIDKNNVCELRKK